MAAVFCGGTSARYRFIEKLKEQLSVKSLCLWLGVSTSGYYAWRKRQLSDRSIEDAELKTVIKKIFDDNKGRYGSPRVFKALIKQGYAISKKRVARLMKELKLVGRVFRVTHRSPGLKRFLASGENLRPQGGLPKEKNKIWVADVTYLKVSGRWQYLSVIMDLFSRKIISWSLDASRTAEVTKRSLIGAIRKRQPEAGLMIHTDRGVEYRGKVYQNELKRNGMVHSLNRAGQCTDNAHMESFFHSMKAELIGGNIFNNVLELRYAVGNYINKYYNAKRLHSGIDYCSPIEYETLTA
ncbi:MAG: putative transposase [Oleiphilaceae bacterium]